jgi:cytidylate kinase
MTGKTRRLVRIAIDGPAGAGKSTVAREVARTLGYVYIDTGAMYRALTYQALKLGLDAGDVPAITSLARSLEISLKPDSSGSMRVFIDGTDVTREIRSPEVNRMVSPVAAIPEVRTLLVDKQRAMAASGDVVMEGRDITTVVMPGAEVKVYLDASPEERARRRARELKSSGYEVSLDEALEEIRNRDTIDSQRECSPLTKGEDAHVLDTTGMAVQSVVDYVVELARKAQEMRCATT